MTPAEKIADDTWHKLKESRVLTVRLGEETLTDLLILDMKRRAATHNFWVYQTTKKQEASTGTDLLVVVRDGTTADARLYAIQGKKLYPGDQYTALRKHNNVQLDCLENYALCNDAIPYFLFYNFVTDRQFVADPTSYWHCDKSYDEAQLGCTLVPSWIVRKAMGAPRQSRPRSFTHLHQPKQALPWRCLFDCRHWERGLRDVWAKSRPEGSPAREDSPYAWLNLDPVPGAWPTELARDNEVGFVGIAERYMASQTVERTPRFRLPDSPPWRSVPNDERALVAPAFRPRRFIFVDKAVQ